MRSWNRGFVGICFFDAYPIFGQSHLFGWWKSQRSWADAILILGSLQPRPINFDLCWSFGGGFRYILAIGFSVILWVIRIRIWYNYVQLVVGLGPISNAPASLILGKPAGILLGLRHHCRNSGWGTVTMKNRSSCAIASVRFQSHGWSTWNPKLDSMESMTVLRSFAHFCHLQRMYGNFKPTRCSRSQVLQVWAKLCFK